MSEEDGEVSNFASQMAEESIHERECFQSMIACIVESQRTFTRRAEEHVEDHARVAIVRLAVICRVLIRIVTAVVKARECSARDAARIGIGHDLHGHIETRAASGGLALGQTGAVSWLLDQEDQ